MMHPNAQRRYPRRYMSVETKHALMNNLTGAATFSYIRLNARGESELVTADYMGRFETVVLTLA